MERITKVEDLENIRSLEDGEYYLLTFNDRTQPFAWTQDRDVLKNWRKALEFEMANVRIKRLVNVK